MRISILKVALPILAVIGVFMLPWTVTVVLAALSALYFPPTALFIGVLAEILYYPGTGLPTAALTGLIITLVALGVRWFAKNRILPA